MKIVSNIPFPCAPLVWPNRSQGWVFTLVCKATFSLAPGTSQLAEAQEDITSADEHWDDDTNRSLRAPGDLVPFKPRADVLLVGSAHAPQQVPARSVVARLIVGEVDKSIEVTLDRWFQPDGSLAEGQRFARMPLVYERSGGGPDTANPVGVRAGWADGMGRVRVPNLTWPGVTVRAPADYVEPVGFGPLAPAWPSRRERLGALARSSLPERWYESHVPDGFDFRYFNAAPPDQQTDFLPPNARIILENLHPSVPRLVTNLPGLQPVFLIEGRGAAAQPMRADTLWIDTDRLLCTLTFRAQIPMRQRDEPGEVRIWLDNAPPSKSAAAPEAPSRPQKSIPPNDDAEAKSAKPVPPRAQTIADPSLAQAAATGRVLPFQSTPSPAPEAPAARPSPAGGRLPFLSAPASSLSAPAPAPPAAPPMYTPPPAPVAPPAPVPIAAPVPPAPVAPPVHDAQATLGGLAAASDAAAVAAPRPEPAPPAISTSAPARRRAPTSEYVDLIWFDERAPQRVRQQSAWASYVRDPQRPTEWLTGEEPEEPTQAMTDRRDIRRALGRVPPLDAVGIARVMEEAIDEDGIFEQPLVLVNGELVMTCDPLETLKTTIAVASQLAGVDKRLKEALDAAEELCRGPRSAAVPLLEGALSRVRQAFAQANRSLASDYLETTAQRILIEERHYLRRKLFGGEHIGGILSLGSGSPLPTYMPEALAEKLPLFPKFRVRAIAEPHPQQDPADNEPITLRVLALGRVVQSQPAGRGGR
ncbi:DUF2169 family type VI secretion system accessory protein [Polyangium jinanense]|uniref:DUF2169 domain-containing protein n=1 Tax=Polyangium jinanense TaxID=2829994 RepID=A0A9X4AWD0_9BACT|nr:DUF2169 domain-containing protein [Polyangium jinanense]MDC3987218.1 DUF2169 domain-containing protein [Polyangium jinanense]